MWRERYGNKYGAKSHVYEGIAYHSKKEAGYAAELDLRVKGRDIVGWERQRKIYLDVNGHHICNYYIDFVLKHHDGIEEFVEVKGFATPEWQLKWKLFEALFGDDKMKRLTVVR